MRLKNKTVIVRGAASGLGKVVYDYVDDAAVTRTHGAKRAAANA